MNIRHAILAVLLLVLLTTASWSWAKPLTKALKQEAGSLRQAPKPMKVPRSLRTDQPIFWTWNPPLGNAADHPNIIGMVRFYSYLAPEAVADIVCDMILKRGLGQGEVCIMLQGFGMGGGPPDTNLTKYPALFQHWCDGLEHAPRPGSDSSCERLGPDDAVEEWWRTPWQSHGIAECRAWMDAFIARYKARQMLDQRIPDPFRFAFDAEGIVNHTGGSLPAFHAMRSDSRWETEAIPGHGGKTLAQLYQEAGEPSYDPDQSFFSKQNQEWTKWYASLGFQAADAAMNEAAYEPIRQAWRGCLSSNFATSGRYDGQGDPARFNVTVHDDWLLVKQDAFGDLQAPVLYWAHPGKLGLNETLEGETLKLADHRTYCNIYSFGGPHDNVTPWLQMLGNVWTFQGVTLTFTEDIMRDMLVMLKDKGIDEFLLWSNLSTQESDKPWNDFVDLVGELWPLEPSLRDGDLRGD